jgi:CoA:oxalate CoA-transferase
VSELSALKSPLDGVQVVDFTNMLSGPYCTRLLADHGAQVIKVEPPAGDHNRTRRPVRNGHSSFFGHLNCGKHSIVLDLKSAAGREAAIALAAKCDVIVENWRPGVADRLGVGYRAISKLNPRVVYCSISGFGQVGPDAQRPAYAPIIHAASGFDLAQVEYNGAGKPGNTATYIADVFGGMSAYAAIQTALFHRERSGEGQYLDVALIDGMLNIMATECQEVQAPTREKVRVYPPLKTLDGFVVVAPTSQKNFEQLTRVVGRPEWLSDAKFVSSGLREKNWAELMTLLEGWTSQLFSRECERLLMEGGVPCTRYRTVAETMTEPQTLARGAHTRISDAAGEYVVPNAPFQMPGLNTAARAHVPALGESTAQILAQVLGYTPAQISACAVASGAKAGH